MSVTATSKLETDTLTVLTRLAKLAVDSCTMLKSAVNKLPGLF